jgi:branched-chain amino acid aminotransferase
MKFWKLSNNELSHLESPLTDFDPITQQLPQGLYTTFRTFADRARVLGLNEHLDRFYLPAKAMQIKLIARRDLRLRLADILRDGAGEMRVRLILDTTQDKGAFYILTSPFAPLPESVYQNGVKVITSEVERRNPILKQTAFIKESSGERRVIGADVFEILLTHQGLIREGMTSNFYGVTDRIIVTAARGILRGVTRSVVIDQAHRARIMIRYRGVRLSDIPTLDEAFISSSSRGIVPVIQIDENKIGAGVPGSMTEKLMKAYADNVSNLAEPVV